MTETTEAKAEREIKPIKIAVRGCYDIQKLRIQTGNRIAANFRVKIGVEPSEKPDAATDKILKQLRRDYALITEGMVNKMPTLKKFKGKGIIDDYTEFVLVAQYEQIYNVEVQAFKNLEKLLDEIPIWNEFLKGVRGVGKSMAGVIISEIDIAKAKYVSSLWKFSGLDVAEDGKGRSRRKEHLIDVEYTDKEGNIKTKKSITFNPFLKTKLTGVLGGSFLKAGGPYADVYYGYKNRLENHPDHKEKTKGHRHNMAVRYTVKCFLKDLYRIWRKLEDLPVHPPYSEAKLGMAPHESPSLDAPGAAPAMAQQAAAPPRVRRSVRNTRLSSRTRLRGRRRRAGR